MFSTNSLKLFGLVTSSVLCVVLFLLSIVYGVTDTGWQTGYDAFFHFDNANNDHLVIRETRLPRALIAAAVGGSLAVAGALMQALTGNPLASPGIFGINAGAGFFVVLAISFFSVTSLSQLTWMAFLGAALSAVVVYVLGSFGRDGLIPLKLTLAGAAIAALFASFTQGLLILNEKALSDVLFWLAGSVSGRGLDMLLAVLPYLAIAWLISFFIAKPIGTLSMGEDVAKGLGQRTGLVKLFAAVIIVLLAGGSVAVAGPIGFIGLVIPNIVRPLVGLDYRWILSYCAVLGAVLLLFADILSRFVYSVQEIPVGVMTALIGTPFFIYIARKGL